MSALARTNIGFADVLNWENQPRSVVWVKKYDDSTFYDCEAAGTCDQPWKDVVVAVVDFYLADFDGLLEPVSVLKTLGNVWIIVWCDKDQPYVLRKLRGNSLAYVDKTVTVAFNEIISTSVKRIKHGP